MVFFDFGGTLGRYVPGVEGPAGTWQQVAKELGFDVSLERVRAALDTVGRTFRTDPYAYLGRTEEYWLLYDTAVLAELDIHGRPGEWQSRLSAVFQDPRRVVLYPEVTSVLERLRAGGFQLGVISNYMDDLPRIIRHLGLDRYLSAVTFSQEAGAEKPDRRPFDLALRQAGCIAAEAIHVGDSFEADYLGAKGAWMQAVWLNRDARPPPSPCPQIQDLNGVLARVAPRP